MNKITSALRRKFGPLPAWAWFLLLIAVLYFYRKFRGSSVSGTGTGSVAPAPATPQPGQVLQPGESFYDPNTGALTTAPGGGGGGVDNTAADLAASMDGLANAIATGMPATQVDTTGSGVSPDGNSPIGTPAGSPAKVGLSSIARKGVGGAGSAILSGSAFSALTTGGKRGGTHSKSKGQHNAQGKTSKGKSSGQKPSGRSSATTRRANGGRTLSAKTLSAFGGPSLSRASGSGRGAGRTKGKGSPSRARAGSRTPAVTTTVRQRPVAQHPRQSPTRQTGGGGARPSAPAPRTQRSPAPPPRRPPPPRKRGK